jgi:hypothetical protein
MGVAASEQYGRDHARIGRWALHKAPPGGLTRLEGTAPDSARTTPHCRIFRRGGRRETGDRNCGRGRSAFP